MIKSRDMYSFYLITNLFEFFSWEGSFHGVSQSYLFSLYQIRDNRLDVYFPKMAHVVYQTTRLDAKIFLRDRAFDRYNHFFLVGIYPLPVFYRIRRHCLPWKMCIRNKPRRVSLPARGRTKMANMWLLLFPGCPVSVDLREREALGMRMLNETPAQFSFLWRLRVTL